MSKMINKSATISDCEKYRYTLFRQWSEGPTLLFIMLNPSTADANIDDPTIRRCIQFAKDNNYGSLYVGNLYGYRSTDPSFLKTMGINNSLGENNEKHLKSMIEKSSRIVVAWGRPGNMGTFQMTQLLKDKIVWCLGANKNRSPKHPLYLAKTTQFELWNKSWNQGVDVNESI